MAPRERKPKSDNSFKGRKSVFGKRFPMVKKKSHELSVLCDISVALICYDLDNTVHAHIYPQNNLHSLRQLLLQFVSLSDQKREKYASHLKDFLPSLRSSKKKNAVFAAMESPIDVKDMSSEEFWAMVSTMDSKSDGWKQKLDRKKYSEKLIASENNGVLHSVTDTLGFGLCDEINSLESGSTTFDQSLSNFGLVDTLWVSAQDQDFGVVDTLGASDIDTCNFGISTNYNVGNNNTCVEISQQDQFLSDHSYLTNNPYQLLNPNPTPIIHNLGVSGYDRVTGDLNPTLIMSNLGVSGYDQATAVNYQLMSSDSILMTDPYQMPSLNPTPVSGQHNLMGGDSFPMKEGYQVRDAVYPTPTPIMSNLGVWGRHDHLMANDSFLMIESNQMPALNPTPITSNLEEVSGHDQLMLADSFLTNQGCQARDAVYHPPMAETNVWEGLGFLEDDDDCLLPIDFESFISKLF